MKRILLPLIAAVMLPLAANAQTFLQFNNSASNTTSGSPATVNVTAGTSFTLSLQINSSVPTSSVDYWLTQASGPTAGAFTIISRDFTGSFYPDPSFTGSFAADNYNNSTGAPGSDVVVDGQLAPRDGPDLGSSTATTANNPAGTFQIANYTIQVSASAAAGTYQIQSFDYPGFGWSTTPSPADQPFDSQAAININVAPVAVPEPSTWFAGIGAAGLIGYTMLRRRQTA